MSQQAVLHLQRAEQVLLVLARMPLLQRWPATPDVTVADRILAAVAEIRASLRILQRGRLWP
jgi:hypothetical protein